MSGMNYPVADQIVDISGLFNWAEQARAEIERLRAELEASASHLAAAHERMDRMIEAHNLVLGAWREERVRAEAAEAAGFQRAIDAALAIIDARHDKIAEAGTEFSPFHAGMVDALSWASDEVGELVPKTQTEGADR